MWVSLFNRQTHTKKKKTTGKATMKFVVFVFIGHWRGDCNHVHNQAKTSNSTCMEEMPKSNRHIAIQFVAHAHA